MDPISAGILAGGSLLGGIFGRKSSGTTTSTTQLPDYLRPYGPEYAERVKAVADSPYQAYDGERVAGFGGDQLNAMDMARQQAMQTSPLWGQAGGQLADTISGQYMDPASNPWLQSTFDSAAGRMADAYAKGTGASTNALFGQSGSFGGSAHQEVTEGNNRAFGDSLGMLANQLYGGNYQAERQRQLGATQFAPSFAGQQQNYGLTNINSLLGIGGMQQGQDQRYLDADYGQFAEEREYPYRQLDVFASMFNPQLGQTAQSTQPGVGALQGAMSGGLFAYGMNRALQPNPSATPPTSYPTAGNLAGSSYSYSPQYGYTPII
jgi:hypothetical protein